MKKLKLFLVACAAMVGLSVHAQEDVTSTYLTNADLSTVDNGWTYYSDAFKYTDWKTDGDVPVVEFYSQWNSGSPVSITQKDFKFSQTVTLPAGDYRIAVNAFYRNGNGDGTNPDKAWIFAGDKKQNVAALTSAGVASYTGSNDLYKAANAFSRGDFSNAFDFSLESEQEIALGFQGFFNTSLSWCILGPVKLYKYSLEDYLVDYRAKVAEAAALYDSPMNAVVLAALKAAVVEESTFSLSSEVLAATATLTTKIADANNSISVYSSINSAISNYATSAAALDEAGAAAYDASDIQTKYSNGTYETLAEAEVDLAAALLVATKAQTTEGSNWTGVIINPSFESDFSNGWNNTGSFARQGNDSFAKAGTYYAEFWQPNGTKTLTQTLTAMPAGVYRLTAHSKARGVTSAKIFAAGVNTPITVADSDADYSVEFACDANANVEIGFEGVGTGSNNSWICVDNFTLTLVSAGLPDVTAAEGKMNADVAAAQTNAISSYNAGKTVAGYNAAKAAIAAAEASIAAYVPFTTAINKIDAAITAATTATASTDSYDAVKATYTNGSVADADIRTAIINAYNAVIPVIKSQTAASADFTLAIQNQSFEYGDLTGWTVEPSSDTGARETSNATYAATGSDGQYLFNTWWKGNPITQAVTNLPNGQYTLTVSVASDGATIYLIANGGHNEGTETGGTYPSSDTFQEANFTFLVKDGSATIGAVGGADGTAGEHKDYVEDGYWWYKADNFRLVKNRALTPEEAAVVPADLAIDATSTIYKGKTTTFAATSTTEGASIAGYVNWTSDNTSVATVDANGVVTGVAYGTANITVTSTLNAEATATCAVTVTAPLITEAENLDFAEGPVKDNMITTYAKDMSTNNTTYSQMQEVNGWTFGVANGDARAAGVMAYGSEYGMGAKGNTFFAPATNPAGDTGNALGMVGVWQGSVQYVQNVKLPAGAYTITVPVYRNGGASALVKNLIGVILDDGTEHLATTTTYTQNAWTTETIKFTVTEETYGKLSLGLNAPNAGSNDCQRLWIDGVNVELEPFATAEEIVALNAAIETAEGKTLGFDEGDYAPYKNVNAVTALAAAKALDTTNPIAQSDVTSATTALTSATWTANTEEVNAVYDGTFAAAENNGAPAGWTMSNNTLGGATHSRVFVGDTRLSEFNTTNSAFFIRFDGNYSDRGSLYYYGNATGYTMPLKAGVTYYAKVDIKGWGSTGKNQRMNITGPTGFSAVSQDLTLSNNADTDDAEPQQFLIVFTASVDGNYVINFQTPGGDDQKHNAVISNVELKRVPEIVLDETVAWTPTASLSANVTLSRSFNSNWATFVVPFDIDNETLKAQFGEDVQVSTISADADNLNFSAMETPAITANEPVIMKVSNTAGTYTFNNVEIKAATPTLTPIEGVQVIGNYGGQITMPASDDAAKYYYIASNKLKYTTGTQTLKGFRAYFSVAADSPVKGFFENGYDFEGLPTAIDGLQVEGANATIYNLAGQRVNKAQKGIYIVNGKKVLVK